MYSSIFTNSLTEGDFNVGRFACQSLTEGDFFPTQDEFYLIYKDDEPGGHDYRMAEGRFDDGETSVSLSQPDLSEGDYYYTRIAVGPTGVASEAALSCLVQIDGEGEFVGAIGNPPSGVKAVAVAGGEAEITWRYSTSGQPAEPDGFKIYHKVGAGAYSLLTTVTYQGGNRYYSYTTDEDYSHGSAVTFDVRTYKDDSELTGSEAAVTVDAQGPAAITGLSII